MIHKHLKEAGFTNYQLYIDKRSPNFIYFKNNNKNYIYSTKKLDFNNEYLPKIYKTFINFDIYKIPDGYLRRVTAPRIDNEIAKLLNTAINQISNNYLFDYEFNYFFIYHDNGSKHIIYIDQETFIKKNKNCKEYYIQDFKKYKKETQLKIKIQYQNHQYLKMDDDLLKKEYNEKKKYINNKWNTWKRTLRCRSRFIFKKILRK